MGLMKTGTGSTTACTFVLPKTQSVVAGVASFLGNLNRACATSLKEFFCQGPSGAFFGPFGFGVCVRRSQKVPKGLFQVGDFVFSENVSSGSVVAVITLRGCRAVLFLAAAPQHIPS
jgi:hypothetical protein